jgi:hypothetical protein
MSRLERFRIDDGRHAPTLVPIEDASFLYGQARYRATCSCGGMPQHPPAAARKPSARMHGMRPPGWDPNGSVCELFPWSWP